VRIEREVFVFDTGRAAPSQTPPSSLAPGAHAGAPVSWLATVAIVWLGGTTLVIALSWRRWRLVAAIARAGRRVEEGVEVDTLRHLEQASGISRPIALVACSTSIEPGVFGVRRPMLLWPDILGGQFDGEAVAAILAHEVAHVKRADNLTAAIHTLVEALFWFHPIVWLIGARLMDERERACDEAVLTTVAEPRRYAETIVQACRVFVESPLACVSGVT
jgi:bla regulator protein blaR1